MTGCQPVSEIQKARDGLNRVQLAIPIEGEPNHMASIMMPCYVAPGIHDGIVDFGENFLDQLPLTRQHDPLPKIGADVQRKHFIST